MIDSNVANDPFARYVSRLKDARLERLNAVFTEEESRSTGPAKALQSGKETLKSAQDEMQGASASSRREDVEFGDRMEDLLAQASGRESIKHDYLAETRPGVTGLPKRLGLRTIRYAVKTYTDGLFGQQEAFNALSTSIIAENAGQIRSLLSRGNELEQKARLQQDFNRDVIACVSAMSDAVSSLSDAFKQQREFSSLIVSLLNDVIDGSSELATALNEKTEQRLGACEKRLDGAEEVLRQQAEENGHRLDEVEAAVRAVDERFEEDERRLEQLVGEIASTSKSVQDTHSFFSLQLEAIDSRIEHSEIRANEASEWMSNLEARATNSEERLTKSEEGLARSEEWLSNLDKEIDSSKQWLENMTSDVKGHGEWLSDVGSQVNGHADWLANLQGTTKEHNDWLSSLAEGRQQLEVWTGNLQKTQEQHASQLVELVQHEKEIDHQVFFVKRKLEESRPTQTLVPFQEGPDAARAEPGLTEDEYLIFEERFRGESAALKSRQEHYLRHFEGCRGVLDLGCGRGEFLELLKERGVEAIGVDSNPEMVRVCSSKGLDVRHADLVAFLEAADDNSLDGIFCAQVVEHFRAGQVLRLCKLMAQKLAPGGVVVIETIDPRSIYALVNNFLLDPSHLFPIHPRLLQFGFSLTDVELREVERLAPVAPGERLAVSAAESTADSDAAFEGVVEGNFRKLDDFLFGYQDYAVVGRKV
ncbi:MAG TPA: methyltransferase domain-containing protein [bacterium]|nr:methyltransferase domain-containing protein [bacterium]